MYCITSPHIKVNIANDIWRALLEVYIYIYPSIHILTHITRPSSFNTPFKSSTVIYIERVRFPYKPWGRVEYWTDHRVCTQGWPLHLLSGGRSRSRSGSSCWGGCLCLLQEGSVHPLVKNINYSRSANTVLYSIVK